jgi:ubiquitin-conjugating enzyme E2 M
MVGLYYLFLEPNADDPLNKGVLSPFLFLCFRLLIQFIPTEAAEDLRRNREKFTFNVKNSMRGGVVNGTSYDNVLVKP